MSTDRLKKKKNKLSFDTQSYISKHVLIVILQLKNLLSVFAFFFFALVL